MTLTCACLRVSRFSKRRLPRQQWVSSLRPPCAAITSMKRSSKASDRKHRSSATGCWELLLLPRGRDDNWQRCFDAAAFIADDGWQEFPLFNGHLDRLINGGTFTAGLEDGHVAVFFDPGSDAHHPGHGIFEKFLQSIRNFGCCADLD